MSLHDAIDKLNQAWNASVRCFLSGDSEDNDLGKDDEPVGGPLTKALRCLDDAWDASLHQFRRDTDLKCLQALFPLYVAAQVHQSHTLKENHWRMLIDQAKNDFPDLEGACGLSSEDKQCLGTPKEADWKAFIDRFRYKSNAFTRDLVTSGERT